MKKARNIMFRIILIFCIFLTVGIPKLSYADGLDPYNYEPSGNIDGNFVKKYVNPLNDVLITVSVIVAVVSLMVLGIKYITGSVQEKADYKKDLIPVCLRNILNSIYHYYNINNSQIS